MSGLLAVRAFVLFVLGLRFRLPLAFCFIEQRRVRVIALSLFLRKNGICDFVQGMLRFRGHEDRVKNGIERRE